MDDATIRLQLKTNLVALISLVVALTALGYTPWRNERTEYNRNVRVAAFETLKQLGEAQINHHRVEGPRRPPARPARSLHRGV